MADIFDELSKKMGLNSPSPSSTSADNSDVFDQLSMSFGLIQDTRPKPVTSPDEMDNAFRQEAQTAPTLQPRIEPQQDPGAADSAFRQENTPLPGRNLPVIGPILKGLDYVSSNPISQAIAEYTVPDAPYIDQPGTNARQSFLDRSGQEAATGVSGFIGQAAAPFFVPGAALGTGAGIRNTAGEALDRFPKLGQGLARSAAKEISIAAPIGFGAEYAQGQADPTQALINAGLGAVGGAAFPLLGAGVRSASNAAGRSFAQAAERPSLSSAVDDFIRRVNSSDTPTPTGRITQELPAPTYSRAEQLSDNFRWNEQPTMARTETRSNPYAQKLDELYQAARQEQLPPGREREALDDLWSRMAGPNDPGLDQLIELATPTLRDMQRRTPGRDLLSRAKETQQAREVAGVPLPVKSEVDRFLTNPVRQAAPVGEMKQAPRPTLREAPQPIVRDVQPAPSEPVNLRDHAPSIGRLQTSNNTDELGFSQTVRTSDNTPQTLKQGVEDNPMLGKRTTDVINRQQAEKLIEKHGKEGLYSKLLAKRVHLSASESTAAQMLAKQYSSDGTKDGLTKSIELVSKSAREGREMGQAIQALSQWNKLDETGALILGERQLNRGVTDTAEWKSLTVEQAAPIQEAAQRVGKAQETKNLAEEVLSIVTNKQPGEALSDAEKATIKQFQTQVKEINDKTKGFLPKAKKAADATIKEVGEIKPKERTRDQVVNFLDAKAEKARQRIAAQRNIGFAATNKGNPAIDLAIIGAAHVAKGIVKRIDFAEQMIKDYGQGIKPMIDEIYNRSVNMFRRENGLPTVEELDKVVRGALKSNKLTGEEAYQFKAWANEVAFIADNKLKVEATQDLQKALKDLGDSTFGQKLSTVQTAGQLLNAVTFGRNILGNTSQIVLEKVNKMTAVPIDWALSGLTKERTVKFFPNNQEKMFTNFLMGTKSGWEGVSPTGTLSSYDIHPEVFGKKNPFKYLTKSLGASLQGFDFAAYRSAYGDVVATYAEQLGKTQGMTKAQIKQGMPQLIKQLDQRIHDMADQAGLYATFQDETLLSQGAQMLKQGLNKITDKPAQMLVEKGLLPKKLSTEGFGLGDVVLKYARTPANLIMRAVDYSPIGIVRSVMELAPLVLNRSKFNQFEATRALSRTITGTLGLTGTGYLLADVGILTGSVSRDKDERSIQEQSGEGAYKVNWSALSRFITSGLDKGAAKYRKGDTLMDYAWIQPAAISVAMGVNANKAVNERKEGADISGWQIAGKAILGGLQTVLENPMVQGVSNVVDAATDIIKKQDATKLANIGKGVPASFVPTVLNQARTSTDNNQRETFDKNLFVEMGNLMANKVPGLSKNLPISYDSFGKARERIQGGQANTVGQYLTAFFSPAKITEYDVSPEAKLVLDLMNQSGDKNILPRISDRNIKVSQGKNLKDLKVDLTAEQYSQLQQKVGSYVESKLSKEAAYLSNPNNRLQNKVDKVKAILTDAGKRARDVIGETMGYKKKDIR